MYTPKEVQEIIGVSASTVRRWANEFSEYLSENAQPQPEESSYYRRQYSHDDLLVLYTIRQKTRQGATTEEVAILLASGERAERLPPDFPLPSEPPEPIEMVPRSAAETRIITLREKIFDLEEQLEQERSVNLQRAERIATLEKELGETKSEVARLQGQVEVARLEGRAEASTEAAELRGQMANQDLVRRVIMFVAATAAIVAAILLVAVLLLALTPGG